MPLHHLGPFTLDTRTLVLLRDGEITKLPMKTVEVLLALLNRRGEIATKDELMRAVWPDSIVEEGNLTVHIALLRKTLGRAAPIETIPKRGYRLVAAAAAGGPLTVAGGQAREAALRGRYFWNKFTRATLERASTAFEEALRLNPDSAEARSGLCDTALMQGLLGFNRDRMGFTAARLHAEAAVKSDPACAEALASLAFSELFDRFAFSAAEEALARARQIAPHEVEPHLWSALFHALRGDTVRALLEAREASAIDPISLLAAVSTGLHLYLTRDENPDLEPILRALELEPDFAAAHWALGLACDRRGDFTRAQEAHRNAVLLSGGSPSLEANLARSLALGGRRGEAEATAERLRTEGLSSYRLATIETAMGENEKAVTSIERAFLNRDPWLVLLKVDPMLDGIREHRRFQAVLKEIWRG